MVVREVREGKMDSGEEVFDAEKEGPRRREEEGAGYCLKPSL